MFLHLDKQFQPSQHASVPLKFDAFKFPGGEQHVRILEGISGARVWITARLSDSDRLFQLALAADAVRRAGGIPSAFIPYFPYARQDRVANPGEPLSVAVAAKFINYLGFEEVRIYDPHSDVTPALLDRCRVIGNGTFVKGCMEQLRVSIRGKFDSMVLIAPDAGAQKKAHSLCREIGFAGQVVTCSKSRDTRTGKITEQRIDGDVSGKHCLIVDDIIDGGATFEILAAKLREAGAVAVHLAVSHGIFSKGTKHLAGLDRIFCTNSFRDIEDPRVEQYQLTMEG